LKGKIRGLTRRNKTIDKWFKRNFKIDIPTLEKYSCYYAKAKIDPWSNLFNTKPYPAGYRKKLFSRLLDLHRTWEKQLHDAGYDFHLQIWLFWPEFIDSQVVASIGEKKEYYQNLFQPTELQKPFPLELFQEESERIQKLKWHSSEDFNYFAESDLDEAELSTKYFKHLIDSLQFFVRKGEDGEEERVLFKKLNDVWVGQ
jgi:hypothetical protein